MKALIYCSMIFFISIYATCNKRMDCSQTIYSFEAFYKAYPDRDSIKVNDTIWLELTAPTRLTNLINNTVVGFSGAENLGTAVSYVELTGGDFYNPGVVPAANSFEYILKKGITSFADMPEKVRVYRFLEENGMYLFKLGVIPKKKGVYAIGPEDAANVYRTQNKCDKASFSLTFKDTDQHLYLCEQSRPGYVLSNYEREHLYCFKVY